MSPDSGCPRFQAGEDVTLLIYPKDKEALRTPGRLVAPEELNQPEFLKNVEELKHLLKEHKAHGVAATQFGWSAQVFVTEEGVFINPRILFQSKKAEKMLEGCLSFPRLVLNLTRPASIDWEHIKPDGSKESLTSTGLAARIVLHELEHLSGKLFIDIASPIERIKFNRWLK